MSDLEEYQKLKAKVDQYEREALRAEGALDQVMQQLLEGFQCTSIKEARTKANKLEAQRDKLKQELIHEIDALKEKWADELNT